MKSTHAFPQLFAFVLLSLAAGCGGGGGGGSTTTPPPATSVRLELFAGVDVGSGNADGPGAIARFGGVSHLASDNTGNLYVAGGNAVRRIDPAGNVTTLAGSSTQGSADGTGREASFFFIGGVAVDAAGNVYVSDTGNKNVRKITPAGIVTTLAGSGLAGSVDGIGAAAQFVAPQGLAVDAQGNVWVADGVTIRKVTVTGVVTTIAGLAGTNEFQDGTGSNARFKAPVAIAVDGSGRLYVSDSNTIRVVTPAGEVSTLAGRPGVVGSVDGFGKEATLSFISDMTVDAHGNLFVLEPGLPAAIRGVTANGLVTTVARPEGFVGGIAFRSGTLAIGVGTAVFAVGDGSTLVPIAGTRSEYLSVDGTGTMARFHAITGMAADAGGNLLVAESFPLALRRVTRDANVVTPITIPSTLSGRMMVADDHAGNAYVATADCPRGFCGGRVSRITGKTLTPLVDTLPDGGLAVPAGLAADVAGNVYFSHGYISCAVYRINPAGGVEVLAGQPQNEGSCAGASVDGTGRTARFRSPGALATGLGGDILVVDGHAVRRITAAGVVTTLAGKADGPGDADGVGSSARFRDPAGLAVDEAGNVYVADTGNSVVRKVTPDGTVTTIAGTRGVVGFVPGALPGVLDRPVAVAIMGRDLFVAMSQAIAVVHDRT